MPSSPSSSTSTLLAAATAFDAELARYEHLSSSLLRIELSSAKALDRAVSSLEQVAASEAELAAKAKRLLEAMGEARDGQQARSAAVHDRATLVQGRKALFDKLAEGQALLGSSATQIVALSEDLLRRHKLGGGNGAAGGAADAPLAEAVAELVERMHALVSSAEDLVTAAKAAGFDDVTRQLDGIRQKLKAAYNRLRLVGTHLSGEPGAGGGPDEGGPGRLA